VADEQVTDKGYEPVRELRPVDEHFARWTSQPSPGMQPSVNTTTSSPMSKRKTAKGLGGLQDRKNRQATRPNPIRGRRADRMAKSTHQ
jgi:hypothetical protein